ncbi:Nn.00g105010.m01.CDS01 [Neocucurbitaria sp. VM-36]
MSQNGSLFGSQSFRSWLTGNKNATAKEVRATLAPHICVLIVLALNIAFYAKTAPTLRLVELTVCREYYREHDISKIGPDGFIDEKLCKVSTIQHKVAWLFMADELLHFCCDFLATMPLGVLADRYGPRPVMLLNFVGLIVSWAWVLFVCKFYTVFRSEMILLASVFCMFGGATHFNTAIIYSEAAIYTKDRTTTFSFLELAIQIGQLTGPVIGSALLMIGIYPPFYFVFAISILSIPLASSLPPGGRHAKPNKRRLSDRVETAANRDETEGLLGDDNARTSVAPRYYNMKEAVATSRKELKRCWNLVVQWKVIQFGYAASLIITLGKQALHILLQYVSKRFGVSIAEAGILFSIKAALVMVLYLAVLPGLQRSLRGPQYSIAIRIARASIVFLTIGITLMGLAWNITALIPGLVIYALGFGFPITVRSLLSSLATTHNLPIPVIFSGMAIAETAGSFIGATVLTGAFTRTLDVNGWARGTPFFICSIFYLIILVPTWVANLEGELESPMPTEREDE